MLIRLIHRRTSKRVITMFHDPPDGDFFRSFPLSALHSRSLRCGGLVAKNSACFGTVAHPSLPWMKHHPHPRISSSLCNTCMGGNDGCALISNRSMRLSEESLLTLSASCTIHAEPSQTGHGARNNSQSRWTLEPLRGHKRRRGDDTPEWIRSERSTLTDCLDDHATCWSVDVSDCSFEPDKMGTLSSVPTSCILRAWEKRRCTYRGRAARQR